MFARYNFLRVIHCDRTHSLHPPSTPKSFIAGPSELARLNHACLDTLRLERAKKAGRFGEKRPENASSSTAHASTDHYIHRFDRVGSLSFTTFIGHHQVVPFFYSLPVLYYGLDVDNRLEWCTRGRIDQRQRRW